MRCNGIGRRKGDRPIARICPPHNNLTGNPQSHARFANTLRARAEAELPGGGGGGNGGGASGGGGGGGGGGSGGEAGGEGSNFLELIGARCGAPLRLCGMSITRGILASDGP